MDKPCQGAVEHPRRCILRSRSGPELDAKVRELLQKGWEREGDVAMAKSVVKSEPPYLCQAMIQLPKAEKEGEGISRSGRGTNLTERRRE